MASERSSLLSMHVPSTNNETRRRRPTTNNVRRNRHKFQTGQGHGQPYPDLLSDSDAMVQNWRSNNVSSNQEPFDRQGMNIATRTSGGRGGGVDTDDREDLIHFQEEKYQIPQNTLPPLPTTNSIKKLQARMHVRERVQMRANMSNSSEQRTQVLYDDDDDDDDDSRHYFTGDEASLDQGPLLNLNATDNIADKGTNPTSASTVPPMVDLTFENGTADTLARAQNHIIMNDKCSSKATNVFDNLMKNDGIIQDRRLPSETYKSFKVEGTATPQSVHTIPKSPPRPLYQPVRHAKRAVSTLFGSSVVLNGNKETARQHDEQSNDLRGTSLLDSVSQSGNSSGLYGMAQNDQVLEMEFCDYGQNGCLPEADLLKFTANGSMTSGEQRNGHVLDSVEHTSLKNATIEANDHWETNINIEDPFSYHARSTINHRNTVMNDTKGNRNGNRRSQMNNSSSIAKSWFGDPLNYTTPSVHVIASDKRVSGSDVNHEHQLLDRLHQEGAEKLPMIDSRKSHQLKNHLNWLNVALFLSYGFTSAASAVPISLIPTIAMDILSYGRGEDEKESIEAAASIFASTVATYAVLGTAMGKFFNGPLGDIFGARRVACIYALLLSIALVFLSWGYSSWGIIVCCAAVEFFQSVQWPCVAVILAAHYGNSFDKESRNGKVSPTNSTGGTTPTNSHANIAGRYEKGIYVVTLGCRCGTLIASISTTILLRYEQDSWRFVCRIAAMGSFFGCAILYMFVTDSPGKIHDPQNPIKRSIEYPSSSVSHSNRRNNFTTTSDVIDRFRFYMKLASYIFTRNVVPSLRSVLSNGTFWVVAIAHSGGLMVCTSVRILGTYFRDTSYGAISENEAGAVTFFLSIGVLVGLAIGGNAFANLARNAQARKRMVFNLYVMTVVMCYALAFLAIPFVRNSLKSSTLVAMLQAVSSFCMGAGVAVQVYCIPAIVGCTFGANKGLYASYTDGVACIVSSMVWRIVGNAVQEGNPQGSGWAYGWAAVALLVILAGLLMVEFIEYYFCRSGWLGRLRDSTSRKSMNPTDPTGGAELNASFAESGKRIWENRPAIFRPAYTFNKRAPEMESILSMADDDTDDDVSVIEFEDVTLPIDYNDIESSQLSQTPTDRKQQVLDLLEVKGNERCIDCGSPFPRWVSIILPNRIGLGHRIASKSLTHQVACFCCTQCSGSHRKLGNHIVFVRSVDYDSFKSSEVLALRRGGNVKVNRIYEALLQDSSAKPSPSAMLSVRERFVAAKYKKKLWYELLDGTPLQLESGLNNDTSMISIELVPKTNTYEFGHAAQFDRNTQNQYEAFVRRGDSDSEDSIHIATQKDEQSLSSEDSGEWHISSQKGLDNLINL